MWSKINRKDGKEMAVKQNGSEDEASLHSKKTGILTLRKMRLSGYEDMD